MSRFAALGRTLFAALLLLGASCFSPYDYVGVLPLARPGNWIIVAGPDSPLGALPRLERVAIDDPHPDAITVVRASIEETGGIRAVVYLGAELEFLTEDESPGIGALRSDIHARLTGIPPEDVRQIPLEDIVALAEEVGGFGRLVWFETDGPPEATVAFVLEPADPSSESTTRETTAP